MERSTDLKFVGQREEVEWSICKTYGAKGHFVHDWIIIGNKHSKNWLFMLRDQPIMLA